MGADHQITQPIVFFDGVCNLCNSSVQFIIKRDHKQQFLFASLQSDAAKHYLSTHEVKNLDSIVLLMNRQILKKSTAALTVAKHLSGAWTILYGLIIIPKFIRDFFYDSIARNRYKWFGKQNECMIPEPALKARFLD